MMLDLFAGVGGADEGARLAGYAGPIVGIETDHDVCVTALAAGHLRVRADVARYPTAPFAGKVEGLWASPPCQSFSRAGKRAGVADERGQLVWQPLRWVSELRPRWVALEQVPEVLPIWRITAAALRQDGYSVWTGVLNAADFGVPQVRKRTILIGRRDGITAVPPHATHGRDASLGIFGDVLPWVTMADALGWGLAEEPSPVVLTARGRQGDSDCLRGSSWRAEWWADARKDPSRWVYERPSTTVQCDPRIGRPGHKDRDGGESQFAEGAVRVTAAEAGVLQGFRADYPWSGPKTKQYMAAGNAVPPPLAAAVLGPLLADAGRAAA